MTPELLYLLRHPSLQISWSLLTPQVGCPLVVDHTRRQCAVVWRSAAEQDVIWHGLVQHGTVWAGIGWTLADATHTLIRQRPVQEAPWWQTAHHWRLRKDNNSQSRLKKNNRVGWDCAVHQFYMCLWREELEWGSSKINYSLCSADGLRAALEHLRKTGREDRVYKGGAWGHCAKKQEWLGSV